MKTIKWTQEMRRTMCKRLLTEFGPYRCWAGKRIPHRHDGKFHALLQSLAATLSAAANDRIEPSAVEAQLNWALTTQGEMKDRSHVRNFILNKAAAMEMGLITSAELPESLTIPPRVGEWDLFLRELEKP